MTAKITPAMRAWCQLLNSPDVVLKSDANSKYLIIHGSDKCPTLSMCEKLFQAGLIEWLNNFPHRYYCMQAVLTELGKEAAK